MCPCYSKPCNIKNQLCVFGLPPEIKAHSSEYLALFTLYEFLFALDKVYIHTMCPKIKIMWIHKEKGNIIDNLLMQNKFKLWIYHNYFNIITSIRFRHTVHDMCKTHVEIYLMS